ncbi:hypothetical protein DV735_g3176, partial [Chaetothyriales sp. CBS 134920]
MLGLQLLRLAPVMLTSAAVHFDYSQYLFLKPFTQLPADLGGDRKGVDATLKHYLLCQFPSGLTSILLLYPLTWAMAAANLFVGRAALSLSARRLYAVGLVFNVSHMLWAPHALDLMETMSGQRPNKRSDEEDNIDLLNKWLRMHTTRSLLVDVPGWLCFTAAFLLR